VQRYICIVLRCNLASWQGSSVAELSHGDYANLLAFRTALRRFDRWSHEQARRVGLTHAQHQLMLAVKGHHDPAGPTIGEASEYLNTRHHSVVGLVDRAERAGLLRRTRDGSDGRVVRLRLTDVGEQRIGQLTELHLVELSRLAPVLNHLVSSNSEPAGAGRAEDGMPS
jgi:DNA-binding MarR family transcriptional regulator